ncbi:helix-turn-helix transcriptional regulator [Oceanobacillus damuensis]|uniref:helix-turn-helix transcriptional regulator n=1 Tax=Oceanobacillus damuensis TaxID=937928 RepID=UPI0008295838|nr:WYL domain-containing protein [Oceanobacillus damuensis]
MERESNFRLLVLRKILFEKTDEQNEMGIQEIIESLQREIPDTTFDKRTIKRDLEILDETDFEIVRNTGKFGKILYSHQARLFETYELRLIIDAILSARFITEKEKNNLIDKVKMLTSKRIAKTLPEPILFSQSSSMDYELVKLNIDFVHHAISEKRLLSYQYGKYNIHKQFEYNRNGDRYLVEPYALIWQNDYYYLIGRFRQNGEMRHYRLDRIRNIEITEERFVKNDFNLQDYVGQSFHMFAGKEIWIKIQFHKDLINVVLDRFGLEADIKELDEDHFILKTKAKLSDGLINWILTWGNKAKVLAPEDLVSRVKGQITRMMEVYE